MRINLLKFSLINLLIFSLPQLLKADDSFPEQAPEQFEEVEVNSNQVGSPEDLENEVDAQVETKKGVVKELPLVEEEYLYIKYGTEKNGKIAPYRDRRDTWGFMFSLGYSFFQPENYIPDFETNTSLRTFDATYGDSSGGMPELTFSAKLNTAIGAFQLGLGGAVYNVSSLETATISTDLTVTLVRLEGALVLDTLFSEPLVAPYILAGGYTVFYEESSESNGSVDGNTQVAVYFGLGANIQLNWLEEKTAHNAYLDYGIENAFLYIEGKTYSEAGGAGDPDFSTGFLLAAGLRVEI